MKKFKKISLVVLLLSLFMVGVLNTTTVTEITSNLLQKKEENTVSYLDISKNKVALMDSYMPNTKVTLYSGLYVSKIKLTAETAGKVYIGVAKIDDVVNARTLGTTYTVTGKNYDVTAGDNTLELNLNVAEDETIVMGGNDSVSIRQKEVTASDYGVYTLTDGKKHNIVIDDKTKVLDITVELNGSEETPVFEGLTDVFNNSQIASGSLYVYDLAPFIYLDHNLFANKTLTKIGIPVKSVSAINDQQFLTLEIIDTDTMIVGQAFTIKRSIPIYIPKEDLGSSTTVNKWIYVDLKDYNITLAADETIGFTKNGDTVKPAFSSTTKVNNYKFYITQSGKLTSNSVAGDNIFWDVYYKGTVDLDAHKKELEEKEEIETRKIKIEKLKEIVKDKNFSIFGDSISTYSGYSNDATNANSTMGTNKIWYTGSNSGITSVNQTWWMQAVEQTGMKLLVNNSSSGSKVYGNGNVSGSKVDEGIGERTANLHDNVGENAGTKPDIITIYIGINDLNANKAAGTYADIKFDELISKNDDDTYTYAAPTNFAEGYAIMLHKIKVNYPDADLFIMNMPLRSSSPSTILTNYNKVIEDLTKHYGANLVDLYSSKISGSVYASYSADNLHPNQTGMDLMTETLVDKMIEVYVKEETVLPEDENNEQNNNQQEAEKNPNTATNFVKFLIMVIAVMMCVLIYRSIKITKIQRY